MKKFAKRTQFLTFLVGEVRHLGAEKVSQVSTWDYDAGKENVFPKTYLFSNSKSALAKQNITNICNNLLHNLDKIIDLENLYK